MDKYLILFAVTWLVSQTTKYLILVYKVKRITVTVDVYSEQFNIDGEKRKIPNSGTVYVARHHKSLQTAALSLSAFAKNHDLSRG